LKIGVTTHFLNKSGYTLDDRAKLNININGKEIAFDVFILLLLLFEYYYLIHIQKMKSVV